METEERWGKAASLGAALVTSPDGRWVAAAGEDGPLRLHAVPSGALLAVAEAPEECRSLAVSPSGRWIAGGCDGALRIWDAAAILPPA